jgi:hypothetical protein
MQERSALSTCSRACALTPAAGRTRAARARPRPNPGGELESNFTYVWLLTAGYFAVKSGLLALLALAVPDGLAPQVRAPRGRG